MSHANARLTVRARLDLIGEVRAGFTQAEAARRFHVSRATVCKWVRRFRQEGVTGLSDRTSRPRRSPRATPPTLAEAICSVRRERGIGPHQISWVLGLPRSTVYAVLKRNALHRLDHLHRVTREVVRYERSAPGELLHLDVKKLACIPQGGGRWAMPRTRETNSGPRKEPGIGYDYLHVAVDDYSRVAFVEAFKDEKGTTTAIFLEHALAFFTGQGVRVQRILTDNALNYGARPFRELAAHAGIRLKHTRPFRPQTNGKAEAFNKILQNEWAYCRHYDSNDERLALLPAFLTYYNHDRPHGGIGGSTPASRL